MKLNQKHSRCLRCHRRLKTEEAQRRGYGYYCYQLHLAELRKRSRNLFDIAEELERMKTKTNIS